MKFSSKYFLLSIYILLLIITLPKNISSQNLTNYSLATDSIKQLKLRQDWVDSVFNSLTLEEKIGQLFMIRAHSNKDREFELNVKKQIELFHVGGVCFFQGGPMRQIPLVNEYNSISKIPLFVSIDGEWGIGMRLDSVIDFPHQMTLGATQNPELVYQIGSAMGKQCKAVGINMDFAPVVDVNSNPLNPVINYRSFGENPYRTSEMAWQIAKGLQDQNVYACAKHFPGHGDAFTDSHKTLPTILGSFEHHDSIHLYPFRFLINKGIKSVMVGHLFVPALDTTTGRASSLSPYIVTNLLFDSLKFSGLAITDALEMKGVSSYFLSGEVELKALMAGNDILLMPLSIDSAFAKIKTALDSGLIPASYLDSKIRKILNAKYDLGLYNLNIIEPSSASNLINNNQNEILVRKSYKEAITLIINENNLVPLTSFQSDTIAVVSIGLNNENVFSNTISKYNPTKLLSLPSYPSDLMVNALLDKIRNYNLVIINVMNTSNLASINYRISESTVNLVDTLCELKNVILVLSANPYSAKRFTDRCKPEALLITYEDNTFTNEIVANSIFGANPIGGKLPVSISQDFKEGFGIETNRNILTMAAPEELGFNSNELKRIDSIVINGLNSGAYPGARVLIAKDGQIFYNKSFGTLIYEENKPVTDSTLYDLASITKIMATTLAVMRLTSEGKLDIDRNLIYYLPELKGTNKAKIVIRDLLAHQAKLEPWIPFYLKLFPQGTADTNILSRTSKEGYNTQISASWYILDSYHDSILNTINKSKLLAKNKYTYSDLGMYYLQAIIERISKTSLENYCDSVFYKPLHLQRTTFNPINKFDKNEIAPTELDHYFRNELIHGYVHDQGAALLGGVGGHAGLFSSANDMAIICQMLLQNGNYGNKQFVDSLVLTDFTSTQFPLNNNRRGLGFDKPLPLNQANGPTCSQVSSKSYGHSGFTGTFFWVDPEYKLIYIFLSNRVYPSAENKKLANMNIRTDIQEELYRQMGVKF